MIPAPTKPKTALATACTAHIVQDGVSSSIYVLLPILAQVFGFSYAQVGLLKGLKNLAQAVFEFCSGWLSEQMGEVRLIAFGLALSGVGYFLLSNAPSATLVAVCLLVIGAGTALHHAPSSALIANSHAQNGRSGALGIYNAAGDVGKLAFTGCFSLAIGVGFGWQQISVFYAIAAFLAAVGIILVTRASFGLPQSSTSDDPNTAPPSDVSGWGILNWRAFGALLVVTSIDTMVQTAAMVFVAFLMLSKGLSLTVATGATVLLLAGGVFGKAGCGYLAERMGVRRAFVVIQTLSAVGLVAVVIAPNWLAMALLMPLGAVVQGTSSITYGFAANLIDPRRMARGYALLYSTGTFASAVGPFVVGVVADTSGIDIAIYGVAFIALLAIPPIFVLRGATP